MVRRGRQSTRIGNISRLVAFATLTAAPAIAENYAACAKFDNPLAYNQCLALHGPVAHGTRAIAPPPEGADGPKGAWTARPRGDPSMQVSHAHNGRMVLEFSIDSAPAGPRRSKKMQ
jgi:hypothetical protein